MSWQSKRGKWNWRRFLTPAELAIIEASDRQAAQIDKMRADWEKRWGRRRQLISNRAIQRARYEARVNQ